MRYRAFKYYLRPTPKQAWHLDRIRRVCCELYNAALQEKRDAYRKQGISLSRIDQNAELVGVKKELPDVAEVYAQVLQDVIRRLHLAFGGFFRRVKTGQKPGYPRFRSVKRYDSFTFPQVSRKNALDTGGVTCTSNNHLKIHGIPGIVRVKWHRPLLGIPRTVTFKREGKRWYVIFACDNVPNEILPSTGRECGVDLGLLHFATLDDGTTIENPRLLRHAEGAHRRAQRKVSRRKKGGYRRNEARIVYAGHCRHVANARRNHAHKVARYLVNNYDRIAVEKLNITGLSRGFLSKSVHDAGWGMFLTILTSKAANAGREVVAVNPAGTSQECSSCGAVVRKSLSERVHRCVCGLVIDRDVNAARNIRARAFARPVSGLRGGQPDVGASDDPGSLAL